MNCDDFARRLADYADSVADADLCREIERHLRECPPCEGLRHDLEDLARLCRQCPQPALPEELRARLSQLLRRS